MNLGLFVVACKSLDCQVSLGVEGGKGLERITRVELLCRITDVYVRNLVATRSCTLFASYSINVTRKVFEVFCRPEAEPCGVSLENTEPCYYVDYALIFDYYILGKFSASGSGTGSDLIAR
jgi:hypothetical protein